MLLGENWRSEFEGTKRWILSLGGRFVQQAPKSLSTVGKFVYKSADCTNRQLQSELGDICNVVTLTYPDSSAGGEIMQLGVNKSLGIKKVLEYFGGDIADTIAIGDGCNDIEMLDLCATGVAMGDATGWSAAENAATKQQGIMESAKMDEIKVILKAIHLSPNIESNNPLLKIRYIDVEPNIKRMKTYEMVTKANAFATYVSHGVYGLHALQAINAFGDVNQVWEDSREMIEKYQESLFNKNTETTAVGGLDETKPNADRLQGDESDQIENSPIIDKQ
jgi:hypothetical protein